MKRISWKRGMRLTDDLLRASDECTSEFIGRALVLAAGGRFGLFPSSRPFELTLNIGGNVIDMESLSCLAVTKNGMLIDAQYDTRYTNKFDTRVIIPEGQDVQEYILTINANSSDWNETHDGFEEPVYTFSLLAPDTPVPDNAMPIGHILEDHGWRLDDVDFVPPCLFVSSHYKFEDLLKRFSDLLATIDTKAQAGLSSSAKSVIGDFWPLIQQLRITISKESDLMTPTALLSNVQKCVSAFTCAIELSDSLELANEKMYKSFILAPYNYKEAYQRIKVGLQICYSISEQIEKLQPIPQMEKPVSKPALNAPYISEDQLFQNCRNQEVNIPVVSPNPKALVLYSTDGSVPNKKISRTGTIVLNNGFNRNRVAEPDQVITIHLKAIINRVESEITTFTVTLHKDYKGFMGPVI